jgi:hypothetical protein
MKKGIDATTTTIMRASVLSPQERENTKKPKRVTGEGSGIDMAQGWVGGGMK